MPFLCSINLFPNPKGLEKHTMHRNHPNLFMHLA